MRQGSTWHLAPASDWQPRNPGWGETSISYSGPSLSFSGNEGSFTHTGANLLSNGSGAGVTWGNDGDISE